MTQDGRHTTQQAPKKDKRPKRKSPASPNPIEAAVTTWLASLPNDVLHLASISDQDTTGTQATTETENPAAVLIAQAPKRWTVYEPMVLLPTGSLTSPTWTRFLEVVGGQKKNLVQELWRQILDEITCKTGAKQPLTHLAINEGIPLLRDQVEQQHHKNVKDNILRSPTGLAMLCGDFGPALTPNEHIDGSVGDDVNRSVAQDDFDEAFWVSTKQNGICQTWAPRWTMFSRGNVKEKARLLAFHTPKHNSHPPRDGLAALPTSETNSVPSPVLTAVSAAITQDKREQCYAVDMYAGIGYFVFSYARLGLRVLCWELNPWSVEGLRRGAMANGWSVRVIRTEAQLARPTPELVRRRRRDDAGLGNRVSRKDKRKPTLSRDDEGEAQIVVFLEDNKHAARRIAELRTAWGDLGITSKSSSLAGTAPPSQGINTTDHTADALEVLHINGGLLPSSTDSWAGAWDITAPSQDSWLHLHENVGVADIENRKNEIEMWFRRYEQQSDRAADVTEERVATRTARVEHVELVKTFAPDVWHCVFDVHVTSRVTAV